MRREIKKVWEKKLMDFATQSVHVLCTDSVVSGNHPF